MRIAFFADLHLSNKNPKFPKDDEGVSTLLKQQVKFVEQFCETCLAENVDLICFLGDYTDYPTMDPILQYYSNKIIKMLVDTGIDMIFLEGNHCITDKGNTYTVISAIEQLIDEEHVTFCYQHGYIEKRIRDELYRFYVFPYESNLDGLRFEIERWDKLISERSRVGEEEGVDIMLFHFPTKNAMLDNGLPSTHGILLDDELAGSFDFCFGGDFHKRQMLVGHHNARYIGAPFDLKFGEHDPERGFQIFEIWPDKHLTVRSYVNKHYTPLITIDEESIENFTEEEIKEAIVRVVVKDDDTSLIERVTNLSPKKVVSKRVKTNKQIKVDTVDDVSIIDDEKLVRQSISEADEEEVIKQKSIDIFRKVRKK